MRFIVVLLIVLFATPAFSEPLECGEFDPKWTECSSDAECLMTENVCGFPQAINTSAVASVEKYNACMGPVTDCTMPPGKPFKGHAACKESKCTFVEKGANSE